MEIAAEEDRVAAVAGQASEAEEDSTSAIQKPNLETEGESETTTAEEKADPKAERATTETSQEESEAMQSRLGENWRLQQCLIKQHLLNLETEGERTRGALSVERAMRVARKEEETETGLLRGCKEKNCSRRELVKENSLPPPEPLELERVKEKNWSTAVTRCLTARKPPPKMSVPKASLVTKVTLVIGRPLAKPPYPGGRNFVGNPSNLGTPAKFAINNLN